MKIILIILIILLPNYTNDFKLEFDVIKTIKTKSNKSIYKLLPYVSVYDSSTMLDLLSEAVVESGFNGSTLSNKYNNYYGIKGKGIDMNTKEYKGDSLYHCVQSFRKFNSIEECVVFRVNRVRKMGTCPNSLYNNLKNKVKVLINNDLYYEYKIVYERN